MLFNTELIAANQDPNPRPSMGIVRVRRAACGLPVDCEVWARPADPNTNVHYVILFNPNAVGTANASFSFTWADAGIPAGTSAVVRDLWKHADLGTFSGGYATAADIAPHEARTLKVTPK